ncbi:MAG TPA: ATP-binding protein [Candidatus Nitrosocosmicus sp.]|nr:ATP-binding protein [Candidatus Nitrosocosmicus sp.]
MVFANDEYPQPDKTEVLHGNDIIIKKTLETFSRTRNSMDGSLDKDGPAVHVLYDPIWNGLLSLKKKGIKIRCITEVTSDNIDYCKKLMEVGELCHLDKDNGKRMDSKFSQDYNKLASNSFQGTGLGLFISKNIVEAHGEKIWASNNKDGQRGATFSFSIPLDMQ